MKAHVPMPQPVTKAREFRVTITKESEELGLDVLQHDSATLLITRIREGLVDRFNRGQPDECIVQAGDRITEVNGSSGNSEELISTIRSSQTICMTIRRLIEFTVTVSKLSQRLGINVMQGGCSLTVLGLTDGPFSQWNNCVNQDLKVQPGDLVVEVDGVRGTAEDLLQAIEQGREKLRMSFVVERGRLDSVPRL
jgi:C-terminal processing protease CtpA/Prc